MHFVILFDRRRLTETEGVMKDPHAITTRQRKEILSVLTGFTFHNFSKLNEKKKHLKKT